MALYKPSATSPSFIAVDLQTQLLPGIFEHALNHLVDHELDLSPFDARYRNDLAGATAYPPAMLLKVVLFAYSLGLVNSCDIERACREHVKVVKSNRTDNESAKMATSKGVIRGYTGVAAVDDRHQIIVEAQAMARAASRRC